MYLMSSPQLLRITTVPISLKTLLKGQHRFMSQNGFDVLGVSSSGNALNEVAQNEKIAVYTVEMTRIISPLKDIKSLWSFYKLCKRERPAIVHSHTPKAGIVGMLGAKLAGVPIRLHTVAGLPLMEATGRKRRLLDFVEKLTYSCATKVYANSKGLYDFILENNFTAEEKLKVIANGSSNGIDTTYFSAQAITQEQIITLKTSLGIHENDFVYVFVGRLVGDKGINELITAFNSPLFSRGVEGEAKLLLVGPFETELDPLLPKTISAIESNPNIISVGFQADVRPYFAISDCLVFPSYREGFPNVVMQAGAMGLPSIVTNINGCNEIIEEGINGLIIPPKEIMALQNAMISLLEDKNVYKNLKNNARHMITSRYEQKLVWEALLSEYQDLLVGSKI
jgi:glycosyltransferase involved in cell wall biosynthesis